MNSQNKQRNLTMDDVVKTRSGLTVRILAVDRESSESVITLVNYNEKGAQERIHAYSSNGTYLFGGVESPLDLIIQNKSDKDVVEFVTSSDVAALHALNEANAAIISQSFNLTTLTSARDKLASALEKSLADRTGV